MTRIASVSLNPVLTCAGSAGLVTGPAFVFLRVLVEAVIAAPLAPVPLQTGEGVESMWHRDTLSQSCDTTKRESSPSYSQVRSSNPQHATTSPHQTESVNAAFRKLLTTQYVVFCFSDSFMLSSIDYAKSKIIFSHLGNRRATEL